MLMINDLKSVVMRKYQNIRLMVQKVTLQLGWKKFLLLKKAKYMVPWTLCYRVT